MPPAELGASKPWAARQTSLNALQSWTLAGRIGVTTEAQGWHASLDWTQQGQDYSIALIGPLGQGRVSIQGDERGVTVQTQDGRRRSAADPQRLLAETLGLSIPVKGLIYWVRGLPDPSQPSIVQGDDRGRLIRLEQDGWVIEYPRYERVGELDLPARIDARQGDLQVRLAIAQWTLKS